MLFSIIVWLNLYLSTRAYQDHQDRSAAPCAAVMTRSASGLLFPDAGDVASASERAAAGELSVTGKRALRRAPFREIHALNLEKICVAFDPSTTTHFDCDLIEQSAQKPRAAVIMTACIVVFSMAYNR